MGGGPVRLFVAVRPPEAVVARLSALEWPDVSGLRWTDPSRWHVTLRFLGAVDSAAPIVAAVRRAAAPLPPGHLTVGPASIRLGSSVLALPVAGAEALAAAVVEATAALGRAPEDRPFVGHLTVARAGRSGRVPASLAGLPVADAWTASSVEVVESRLGGGGPRYETVATVPLTGETIGEGA